ncbi:MAG: helix-turn-helix domain-containing protein [Candidatus Doudnabacteria bacterium]|nr:helix-turn-helix domain-containing protein [Candidatus Doudnabacteria bacterium]
MRQQIEQLIKNIDLNNNEIVVLSILLEHASLKVKEVARLAKLNRTTAYGVLKSLIEKGLASSTEQGKILEFQSISPRLLVNYIENKKLDLSKSKAEIEKILPEIEAVRNKQISFPKIQFFQGIEGIKQAYEDTLLNNKEKNLYDFTGTDAVFKKMGADWVYYYITKRAKLGIKCYDIAPDTDWSRESKKRDKAVARITKFIPIEYAFDTEIDIYDDKTAIFSFSENNPIAVIIEDKNIANTLKALFKYVDSTIRE